MERVCDPATVSHSTRYYGRKVNAVCLPLINRRAVMMNRQRVRKISFGDQESDAEFWRSRPPEERLRTLESIRCEYHDWPQEPSKHESRPQLQRVCRVLKRT